MKLMTPREKDMNTADLFWFRIRDCKEYNTNQKVNQSFVVDAEHVNALSLYDTYVYSRDHDPLKWKLDVTEENQLQGQDMHLSKIIEKCQSQQHHDKTILFEWTQHCCEYNVISDLYN